MSGMTGMRRLAWLALIVAYVHTVFGAIVRISGSGMGCGEHWPDCNGQAVPTITNYTVAVEVSHRYLAALLLVTSISILVIALLRRRQAGYSGPGGLTRPAGGALVLILLAAILGMVVVKLSLSNPYIIAVHYTIAMLTLACFVVLVQRTGGLGGSIPRDTSPSWRSYRTARGAAIVTFLTLMLGALTANVPGAAQSCRGFPLCRTGVFFAGAPLHLQVAHRVLAGLLFLHLASAAIMVGRRPVNRLVVTAARAALGVITLQILIAAMMVESGLPGVLQSLHQAVGTLLWITVFTYAAIARRAAGAPQAAAS